MTTEKTSNPEEQVLENNESWELVYMPCYVLRSRECRLADMEFVAGIWEPSREQEARRAFHQQVELDKVLRKHGDDDGE